MPNDRGVVRGHTPTIGTYCVEADRASLASSCPLPRHATFWLCVPGVRASSTFDSRGRHPRLISHCRCRGSVLLAHLESLMTLKLVRMPRGRGRAVSVTCQCIFFVEGQIHVQVTPLDRPLPAGEGWGEGLPATSVSSISSQPLG